MSLASSPLCWNTSIPSTYFQNAKQLTIPAAGASHFHCCCIYSPRLADICQFYVRGLGMPAIVLQHENDVNFPTGPFSVRCRRQSSWQFLQRCQHITSFTKLLPCSSALSSRTLESYRGREKKKEWCHLSNRALNLRVNVLARWALEDDDGGGDDDGAGHWSGHSGDDNDDVILS